MALTGDFVTGQTVSFQRMRSLMAETALQEGVVGATDLQVIQRAAGANMSVDVGAGAAWVQIDTGTRNGLAHVYNDAAANVVVSASNATNPRVDQVVVRYNDASIPTGAGNVPTLEVLTGTATAGATLDNRTGATALPNDMMRLADILVPATSTSVTTANIRDRRPWARGAFNSSRRTAGDVTGGSATTQTALMVADHQFRIECSGVPLRVVLSQNGFNATANASLWTGLFMDGATQGEFSFVTGAASNTGTLASYHAVITPPAGSHLFVPTFRASVGSWTFSASATVPSVFLVEELVRPATNNGTA